MTQQELQEAFVAFIEKEDEEGARAFLIEHINDFPEEIRKEIAFSFFVDAVQKDAKIEGVKRDALAVLKDLEETESVLLDAQKASDIKNTIG